MANFAAHFGHLPIFLFSDGRASKTLPHLLHLIFSLAIISHKHASALGSPAGRPVLKEPEDDGLIFTRLCRIASPGGLKYSPKASFSKMTKTDL
jgi:hypothetical protein